MKNENKIMFYVIVCFILVAIWFGNKIDGSYNRTRIIEACLNSKDNSDYTWRLNFCEKLLNNLTKDNR